MSIITALTTSGSNSMAGNLNLNSHLINNVLNPVNPQDVATKNYTDTSISTNWQVAGNSGLINGKIGTTDTNSFAIICFGNQLTTYSTSGISLNSHTINNVGNPVNPQDAATKSYTDVISAASLQINGSNNMTGNLNIPSNNVIIGGTANTQNLAALSIKQSGDVSNTPTSSICGIKMYKGSTNNYNYYFGVDGSGFLSFYFQATNGTCTTLFSVNNAGQINFLNTGNIINMINPVNPQDGATKYYVDNVAVTTSVPLLPLVPLISANTGDRSGWTFSTPGVNFAGSGYTPFSGGTGGPWQPTNGTVNSISCNSPFPIILRAVSVQPLFDNNNNPSLTNLLIEGSNNNSTFTQIFNYNISTSAGQYVIIKFSNSITYAQIRLTFTFTAISKSGINSLQLYGSY
jgi:hypothetical protein